MSATAERDVVTRTIPATPAEIFAPLVDRSRKDCSMAHAETFETRRRSGYQFD
jgi:hypothetical protein